MTIGSCFLLLSVMDDKERFGLRRLPYRPEALVEPLYAINRLFLALLAQIFLGFVPNARAIRAKMA